MEFRRVLFRSRGGRPWAGVGPRCQTTRAGAESCVSWALIVGSGLAEFRQLLSFCRNQESAFVRTMPTMTSATFTSGTAAPSIPMKQDATVIGLVGLAHASSHFGHLILD